MSDILVEGQISLETVEDGEDGADGKSAYESAIEGGLDPDEVPEEEFNSDLSEVPELNERIVQAEDDISGIETDISGLSTRVTTAEGDISDIETGISGLSTRVTAAEDDISGIETDISGLSTRVTTAEGAIDTVETDISGLSTRVTTAEGAIDTVETDITGLQTRVAEAEDDIDAIDALAQEAKDSATVAGQAAATAQAAAEASIEANYRKYNAISLTQAQIDSLCAHGSVNSWNRASAEGYYQGACNIGDVLLIYVTKPDTTVGKLLVRVTTASSAGQPTTGETISWDDNINAHFWHDSQGAHVLGDTYRTDIKDGLEVVKNSDGTVLADINPGGATFKSGNGTEIAHLGYGPTQGESGQTDAPYYDLGVRTEHTRKGAYSVAEGCDTTADGFCSHAEGNLSSASGSYAHAEGTATVANRSGAHAEGDSTWAMAVDSHTEGYGTYVSPNSPYQHAQGKFNVIDGAWKYADIIGNGDSVNSRSNAYALEWNGNGRFAGDVYVGCNADSSGGTKLVKTDDSRLSDARTPTEHTHDDRYYTEQEINALLNEKADASDIPTKTSELTNDSGFIGSSYFITDIITSSEQTVNGSSNKTILIGVGKQGYTPVGIIGVRNDISTLYCHISSFRIDGNNARIILKNTSSNAQSGTITVTVLYKAN